jgi:hypothetical protein
LVIKPGIQIGIHLKCWIRNQIQWIRIRNTVYKRTQEKVLPVLTRTRIMLPYGPDWTRAVAWSWQKSPGRSPAWSAQALNLISIKAHMFISSASVAD